MMLLFLNAGFATTVVACDDKQAIITVAKRGEVSVTDPRDPNFNVVAWGQYSAVDVIDNTAWFAGSVATQNAAISSGTWITPLEL
jgi:hypothetical protein